MLKAILLFLCFSIPFSLYSNPDLTIVGFVDPDDGIGKHPIIILEALGNEVSANFVNTLKTSSKKEVPPTTEKAIKNSDPSAGKIALLTDILGDNCRKPATFIPKDSIIKLAFSVFETTRIPHLWVETLNKEFDAVIVPDKFLSKVYHHSGVKIPIFVLPFPMMLKSYYSYPLHSKQPSNPFVFGDASANKNPAILIESFLKAFGNNPKVQLKLRASGLYPETRETIDRMISQFGSTNISYEEGKIDLHQFINCLSSYDCYVNLSKGEGFSFIPREALALGLPVIIPNNTASSTICESGYVRIVPSSKKVHPLPVYKKLFDDEYLGNQYDCEVDDVVNALRDVYSHYEEYIEKARMGRKWVDRYNCENPLMKNLYITLIKPKKVILGKKNIIQDGTIMTTSQDLFVKYQLILGSNQ